MERFVKSGGKSRNQGKTAMPHPTIFLAGKLGCDQSRSDCPFGVAAFQDFQDLTTNFRHSQPFIKLHQSVCDYFPLYRYGANEKVHNKHR
jgi:hypothetical protein